MTGKLTAEEVGGLRRQALFKYDGEVESAAVDALLAKVHSVPSDADAVLYVRTLGGDPHSGYRLARSLRRHFGGYTLVVFGACKSAGTLFALGADEVVFGPFGELGPIDIQLRQRDELAAFSSSLDINTAFRELSSHTFQMFEDFFIKTVQRSGGGISTPTASHLAVDMVTGLVRPIVAQIDPASLGQAARAVQLATHYGGLLNSGNVRAGAIHRLTYHYPDHGCVIDLEEAEELFHKTRAVNRIESVLCEKFRTGDPSPRRSEDAADVDAAAEADAAEAAEVDATEDAAEDAAEAAEVDAAEAAEVDATEAAEMDAAEPEL